jgi:PAS domain S-box-containing protein
MNEVKHLQKVILRVSKNSNKYFTDPVVTCDPKDMGNIRFMSGVYLIFILAIFLILFFEILIYQRIDVDTELLLIDFIAIVVMLFLYILTRFGYYKASTTAFIIFTAFTAFYADQYGYAILFYLPMVVLISVFVFPLRITLSVYLLILAVLVIFLTTKESYGITESISTVIYNTFMGGVIIIYSVHLKNLEYSRTKELKKAQERFKGLAENTSAAIVIHRDSTIIYANRATKDLFGFKDDQVRYKDMTQLFDYKSKDEQGRHLLHTTGNDSWGKVHKGHIDVGGEVLSVTTILDETEMKEYEMKLLESRDEAERSRDVKEQFLANVSHEIRTPLNGVIGLARLLEETDLTEEQEEYVKGINYSSSHLGEVINDILDLSKVNSGKLRIRNRDFSLKYLIEEVESYFQNQLKEKDIKLLFQIENKLPHNAVGDATRIRQILFNIIGNSIKFTDHGEIKLNIKFDHINPNEIILQIKISDTGIGISESDLPTIFESFERASSNREGTGLGLSISKKLLELMNGSIEVESEVGLGTIFYINLPLKIKDINSDTESVNIGPIKQKCPKILLVEDDRFNQLVTSKLLEKHGYEVDLALNGTEGIQKSNLSKYCAILMDLHLPDIPGVDVAKEIRTQSTLNSNTPIIAFSANHSEIELRRSIEAGMNDFVSKPFDANHLLETISKYLPKKPSTL